jgi:hypothetical protein
MTDAFGTRRDLRILGLTRLRLSVKLEPLQTVPSCKTSQLEAGETKIYKAGMQTLPGRYDRDSTWG